jgi:hypothetical protein
MYINNLNMNYFNINVVNKHTYLLKQIKPKITKLNFILKFSNLKRTKYFIYYTIKEKYKN